ncbi:MAG: ATP-binding protein [Saprospiraceae bacterium]|uniref:ATP-binding protein n=1 Tax=Candidatus Opimibacter skivensis TaxID=2982028 RepID=A0A9D7XPQ7_9BACT|nr:ATP-binding protein [Candidatus Opimibacter skivensis]
MSNGTKLIRNELEVLKQRMNLEPRKFIQVVTGPRQVGKTTLVIQFTKRTTLPVQFSSADAIATDDKSWISLQWQTARIKLQSNVLREAILIIDEIQKIKNWSEQIKREWDADTRNDVNLKIILLGSSRLLLQQGLTESLTGRFESIYLSHWTFSEMNAAFGFSPEEYVWFGGYPGSASLIQDEIRWKNYVRDSLIETSISMDIMQLTRVDKPALMRRLFDLGSQYSGQILSFNKILGQLQDAGNTTTLSHYLNLLDTAGLLAGLEKYSHGKVRQRGSIPKFQVHNTALMTATQPEMFSTIYKDPARWGRWVESCVGAHLLNASLKNHFTLNYWRHVNDEIDFVMTDGKKTIGIEVTTAFKHRRSGINGFVKAHHPDKVLKVGADGISWQEFIRIDPKTLM